MCHPCVIVSASVHGSKFSTCTLVLIVHYFTAFSLFSIEYIPQQQHPAAVKIYYLEWNRTHPILLKVRALIYQPCICINVCKLCI